MFTFQLITKGDQLVDPFLKGVDIHTGTQLKG
jgi:hypothetical protein